MSSFYEIQCALDALKEEVESLEGDMPEDGVAELIRENYWDLGDLENFATIDNNGDVSYILANIDSINEWGYESSPIPRPENFATVTPEQRALLDLLDAKPGLLSAVTTLLRILTP
jgi:hypothetical protein